MGCLGTSEMKTENEGGLVGVASTAGAPQHACTTGEAEHSVWVPCPKGGGRGVGTQYLQRNTIAFSEWSAD